MMKTNKIAKAFLSIYFVCFIFSCKTNEAIVKPQNSYLVSSTLVKEYTKEEVTKQLGTALGLDALAIAIFVRSGIKQYKIIYNTKNTDGTSITASGALILPKDLSTEQLSLVSIQHGTIINETDAPSYFNLTTEAAIGSFFSSVGYIIAMPDYIGYGASSSLPHTYEHREGLATASLDMIRAVKEYINDNAIKWNQNLMIGGYSEGGYANMALQKKIEEEYSTEFNLKASSSGAGAYNKTQTLKYIINTSTNTNSSYNSLYLWVLLTYDRIYKLNHPMSYYFIEPHASLIDKVKQKTQISLSLNKIITDNFKLSINNATDISFMAALKDNDIYDWKPKTPTQLYHGDADDLVPYFNSKTAYDAMLARGATTVTLIPIKNGTHASSISSFLTGTFQFFGNIK